MHVPIGGIAACWVRHRGTKSIFLLQEEKVLSSKKLALLFLGLLALKPSLMPPALLREPAPRPGTTGTSAILGQLRQRPQRADRGRRILRAGVCVCGL
jgi:hypothetical protein